MNEILDEPNDWRITTKLCSTRNKLGNRKCVNINCQIFCRMHESEKKWSVLFLVEAGSGQGLLRLCKDLHSHLNICLYLLLHLCLYLLLHLCLYLWLWRRSGLGLQLCIRIPSRDHNGGAPSLTPTLHTALLFLKKTNKLKELEQIVAIFHIGHSTLKMCNHVLREGVWFCPIIKMKRRWVVKNAIGARFTFCGYFSSGAFLCFGGADEQSTLGASLSGRSRILADPLCLADNSVVHT